MKFDLEDCRKLEVYMVGQTAIIAEDVFAHSNVDVSVTMDMISKQMIINMRGRFIGEKNQRFEWPETWIDAFRVRWFPKWLLAKYPASIKTVDTRTLYPTMPLPDHKPYMDVVVGSTYFPMPPPPKYEFDSDTD